MAAVKNRHTKPERVVRSMLHRLGFRFRLHRRDIPGTPDIVLPKHRAAVFVHGCFWHGHSCNRGKLPTSNKDFWRLKIEANKARDKAAYEAAARAGWRVIIVWSCELGSAAKRTDLALRLEREIINKDAPAVRTSPREPPARATAAAEAAPPYGTATKERTRRSSPGKELL